MFIKLTKKTVSVNKSSLILWKSELIIWDIKNAPSRSYKFKDYLEENLLKLSSLFKLLSIPVRTEIKPFFIFPLKIYSQNDEVCYLIFSLSNSHKLSYNTVL